jgi:hypothetical protein
MRQPDNLPAFCPVHRNGRPLIGRIGRWVKDAPKPAEAVETVLAMFLMLEQEPRRFRSDDAFRFQLARRVRGLTDVNQGTWFDHRAQRVKRVYRDAAPKTTAYIGELLAETLGAAAIHLARLEQTRSAAKKQEAEALWANLEKLQ